MRRILVVINPSSCDFEAQRRFPELEPILRGLSEVEVLETFRDDQKTVAAIEAALGRGFDRVVSIGGDGTAHLVLNGMFRTASKKRPELALIPFGTANNVSKSLGLPLQDLKALARIAAGDRLGKLDVGRLVATHGQDREERYFVNCATIGMDADVLAARENYRDLKGYLAYAAAIAERAVEQHSFDARITIDGGARGASPEVGSGPGRMYGGAQDVRREPLDVRVFNAVITNVPMYAGELMMPGAKRDDGVLDLYLFNRQEYASKMMSLLIKQADLLRLGVSEFLEEITQNQRARHGRSIRIRLASPRRVQVDGEILGEADEVELEAVAQLEVAVP